jgi:hypothetical protein
MEEMAVNCCYGFSVRSGSGLLFCCFSLRGDK